MAPKSEMPPPRETSLAQYADNKDVRFPSSTQRSGFIARFQAAVAGWMSPGVPLQPQAPDGTVSRQYDYPVNYNYNIAPRSGMEIGFGELISLADSYDILRIVIERRKDQIVTQTWDIQSREGKENKKEDADIDEIKAKLRFPDNEHDWTTWLRAVLEQLYVIDAVSIEPVYRGDGKVFGLYGIHGATIQLKIDEQGRTPAPPSVAYQQIVKGLVATDFTTDELIYKPWNLRFSRVFGFSKVEQILMTINIGLRREMRQLLEFTAGTLPSALMETPQGWTPSQIREYNEYFTSRFANNLQRRAELTFVPYGSKPMPLKGDPLKGEFDEWLVRITCFAFGVSPTGFVRDSNKATADSARQQALQEGAGSDMMYVKSLMDMILVKAFKRSDLEFVWSGENQVNPLEQAELETAYIKVGVYSVDEVRKSKGLDPIGMGPAVFTASGAVMIEDILSGNVPGQQQPGVGDDQGLQGKALKISNALKAAKKKRFLMQPLIGRVALVARAKNGLAKLFRNNKDKVISAVWKKAAPLIEKAKKSEDDDSLDNFSDDIDLDFFEAVPGIMEPIFIRAAVASSRNALVQVSSGNIDDALSQMDEAAHEWAKKHAAEMVGRKWVDGKLVDNPNAAYSIEDSTRNMIRDKVSLAIEEGWTEEELARELEDRAFDADRAYMIASTELDFAHSVSNNEGWKASGVVQGKKSLLSQDHVEEDECDDNADAGVIDLDEEYPSGHDSPPFHPRCHCSEVAVLIGDDGQEEEGEEVAVEE